MTLAAADRDTGDAHAPSLSELLDQVPVDPWFRVRTVAMTAVAAVYLWWLRVEGLVTDRISGAVAVGVFLVAAFVGKPWQRWAQVGVGACLYVAMWFAYESTRGLADHLGMPYQMAAMRNIDHVLFLGARPNEWVQQHWYTPGEVRLHDQVLSLVYYSHFVVPVVAVAAVWAAGHVRWVRYMRRFATVLFVACVTFVVLPTVPPWMASDPRFGWGVGQPLVRHVRSGILDLGFRGFAHNWNINLDWSNVVAAMPSLHAAFSLFVVVHVRPMIRRRWLRIVLFAYPLAMALALVYFAEHWVIDVLVGWALTAAAFALWARLERDWREERIGAATAACADLVVPVETTQRSSRDPAVVLLDRSFLAALADATAVAHADALSRYGGLLDRFAADEVRLVARRDHLAALTGSDSSAGPSPRSGLLAAVRPLPVPAQYRRQAARLALLADRPDDRLTLVVARRERAVAIATCESAPAGAG